MSLLTAMAAAMHRPTIHAYLDGQPLDVLSATVDHGFDVTSAAASVILNAVPSWVTTHGLRKNLEIWLGYDGFDIPVFRGWIEDDSRRYFPFDGELAAAGALKQAQYQYPSAVTYANQTDKTIKEDLLTKAGISAYSVDGEDTTNLGTVQVVTLEAGQAAWDLLNQIDQLWGYKTFDCPDGVVRSMRISGVPASSAAFAYVQGAPAGNQLPILSIERPRSIRGIHNKVVVTGLPQETFTPGATRQASNPLVPTPPTYVAYDYLSDLVETDAVASAVALRLMGDLNGILEEIIFEAPGNPYLSPGMTISITSEKLGLASATNFFVQHVTHNWGEQGFYDNITAMRIEGGIGYELGKAPVPVFTFRITKEQYDVAGVPTTMYTVTCDGSASWDPDSPPDTLTFAWSNNKNADTGTAKTYSTAFTQAQMDNATAPTITLIVADADATSPDGTLTQTITDTGTIATRDLYVAADGRAEATAEGDVTWNTWTPGAGTVVSVPPIITGDYGYWGLNNGKLMQSSDHLATAPTEIHDFGAQSVTAIYINRVNPNRVTVGLDDGSVYLSLDADQGVASTWTLLYSGTAAILALWEDDRQQGQYRFVMGEQGLITYDEFAHVAVLIEFGVGDTARAIAPSSFANYFCGTTAAGPAIKRDDGTPITFGDGTVDVRAIAHHIRDDVLYAARLAGDGTTINTYIKLAGATVFTAKATVALGGQPNSMVADPDNQLEFFIAANQGLYKTFDGFGSLVMVRDYTAAGINGLQVGIGALALPVTGIGARVLVAGISGATFLHCAYTENVWAASPTWVSINSGLPANAINTSQIRVDPYHPTERAYLIVHDSSSLYSLWRNDDYRYDAWANILDLTSLNVLLGTDHTQLTMARVQLTIADEGRVYVAVQCQGGTSGTKSYLLHSHNWGDTWTALDVTTVIVGTASWADMAVGQWNADRVYMYVGSPWGGRVRLSTDGGHSSALTATGPGNPSPYKNQLILPYAANVGETELFAYSIAGDGEIRRSTDSGDTWVAYGTDSGCENFSFVPGNEQHVLGSGGFAAISKRQSVDRALTWTQVDGPSGFELAILCEGRYYWAGNLDAGTAYGVWTSLDWVAFTGRRGNLLSIFAGGTPDVKTITVDPTS